jgi:hypothetical protein
MLTSQAIGTVCVLTRGRWLFGHVWDGGPRRRASAPVEVLAVDVTARNAHPREFRSELACHAGWAAHEDGQRVRPIAVGASQDLSIVDSLNPVQGSRRE